jgi:guanyl-specific ribonuclease Sa
MTERERGGTPRYAEDGVPYGNDTSVFIAMTQCGAEKEGF